MLDSLVVDSTMQAFNMGVKAGILTYTPVAMGAVAIIVVIGIISGAIHKA